MEPIGEPENIEDTKQETEEPVQEGEGEEQKEFLTEYDRKIYELKEQLGTSPP